MSTEKLIEGRLATLLARRSWTELPTARLHYDPTDDVLVVELVDADPVTEVDVLDRLLVELDGSGPDALPVALTLTGLRADPDAPEVVLARALLGEHLWTAVESLAAGAGAPAEVALDEGDVAALRPVWRELVAPGRWIGVEILPSRVHAVLADGGTTVLDEEIVDVDRNDVEDVVAGIADAVAALERRDPGLQTVVAPVAVQIGGPVDTASGVVEYYDKAVREGDEAWKDVPLAALIEAATRHRALVFNDAWAFAELEAAFGLGRDLRKVVVLVVRQGIGAKLVHRGSVADDFPMEIGMVVYGLGPDLDEVLSDDVPAADQTCRSIEAGSGVRAIIAAVNDAGHPSDTIHDAGDAAERSAAALAAFRRAGVRLAFGMAAVQALINPQAWVVVGPDALVDVRRRSAREFLTALRRTANCTGWSGFLPAQIVPRSTTGTLGAQAAVVAALRRERAAPTVRGAGGG